MLARGLTIAALAVLQVKHAVADCTGIPLAVTVEATEALGVYNGTYALASENSYAAGGCTLQLASSGVFSGSWVLDCGDGADGVLVNDVSDLPGGMTTWTVKGGFLEQDVDVTLTCSERKQMTETKATKVLTSVISASAPIPDDVLEAEASKQKAAIEALVGPGYIVEVTMVLQEARRRLLQASTYVLEARITEDPAYTGDVAVDVSAVSATDVENTMSQTMSESDNAVVAASTVGTVTSEDTTTEVTYNTGGTPAPTIPTPMPTITPAPESGCEYEDEANGPFALDCLQALFLQRCSMRGDSYPTDTREDGDNTGDKENYNAMTWAQVNARMTQIADENLVDCKGVITSIPTPEPTKSPVTRLPTPSPTRIPTTNTPAPTYATDYKWTVVYNSQTPGNENVAKVMDGHLEDATGADAGTVASIIASECERMGYKRQYDFTQYIVKLEMGEFVDYFTYEPQNAADDDDMTSPDSVCDMLADPVTYPPMWSRYPEGPYQAVDITSADADLPKTPDNRVYPSWYDRSDSSSVGGYGSVSHADLTVGGGRGYILSISSMRKMKLCNERASPFSMNGANAHFVGDSPAFETHMANVAGTPTMQPYCNREGSDGQKWARADLEICDGGDVTNLAYAIANRMFGSCDSYCVYSPNYPGGSTPGDAQTDVAVENEYWWWNTNSGGGCWKRRSQYTVGEFQNCDPTHGSYLYQADYDLMETWQATLCSERCDLVNGFVFIAGTCYKKLEVVEYQDNAGASMYDKAQNTCVSLGGNLASITSLVENNAAVQVCDDECYFGLDSSKLDSGDGNFLGGQALKWENWNGGYEAAAREDGDYITLQLDGTWLMKENGLSLDGLCQADPDLNADMSNQNYANTCMKIGAGSDVHQTNQTPQLDIDASGFTEATEPGKLYLRVTIPKYMYNPIITFENSTNDAAEYNWGYEGSVWTVTQNSDPTGNAAACDEPMELEGAVDWTVFNLGGAGGIQRLATWETFDRDNSVRDITDPRSEEPGASEWEGSNYLFGSVMMIRATQPVYTNIDIGDDLTTYRQKREVTFQRDVVARIPFILQFQKSVTVSTDVDLVAIKFNYKTVAAIIQSIQYDTQYFEPPYAVIKMQIRTKSQYPYRMDQDEEILLHPRPETTDNDNIAMEIAHLMDDVNCTFTNPDHVREGDICTQEWMVTLTPNANVCYATGEYSIEFKATCFHEKEVCYLPFDDAGEPIETVTFTFKIQTSKFCPRVAEEVDLSGEIIVTGRESFKPETVEDDTPGSFYLQGEKIHVIAKTYSEKAVIIATEVTMVELVQDLSRLVQTGYNRVPYDEDSEDMTVWTAPSSGRVVDGEVTINDGVNAPTTIRLMEDAEVFPSGSSFVNNGVNGDGSTYDFEANEAGFMILVHARAMPVNVDSFAEKTLVATLGVTYEALGGITRRRLLTVNSHELDIQAQTSFNLKAFEPLSLPSALGGTATMAMEITMQGGVSRSNVRGFVQSFEDAVVAGLALESGNYKVYEKQVAAEAVYSKGVQIWSRPNANKIAQRRLLQSNQRLKIVFTFASMDMKNAMPLEKMIAVFNRQLRSPFSPMMTQPIFYGSVIHSVYESDMESTYVVDTPTKMTKLADIFEEKSAASVTSMLVAVLASLMFALW